MVRSLSKVLILEQPRLAQHCKSKTLTYLPPLILFSSANCNILSKIYRILNISIYIEGILKHDIIRMIIFTDATTNSIFQMKCFLKACR